MSKKILIPLTMILTTLLLCVPVYALRADTVVIGGGWIIDEADNRANFTFNFDSDLNGQVQYNVHGEWYMSSTAIISFTHRGTPQEGPTWVEITGTCMVTDLSTGLTLPDIFQLEVEDFGEPGGEDIPHEDEPGDWIIMYVGGYGQNSGYWYCSWEGAGDPPEGQGIDGGNILHMGEEAQE